MSSTKKPIMICIRVEAPPPSQKAEQDKDRVCLLHAQCEQGKVIGVGVHIYICIC